MTERTTMEPMTETETQSLKAKAEQAKQAERLYDAAVDAGDVSQRARYKEWVNARNEFEKDITPDAILRLLALVEQATWQPIETAPEEGPFLVYEPTEGEIYTVASMREVREIAQFGGLMATHWHPHPPAPTPADPQAETSEP